MLAVKKYGSCDVYEIPTGYEDIDIRGINGITFDREMFAKQIFNYIVSEDNSSLSPEERVQKVAQTARDNKIWGAIYKLSNITECFTELNFLKCVRIQMFKSKVTDIHLSISTL